MGFRTEADWLEIFSKTPSPNSVEYDIAHRIIADLWGYNHKSTKWRHDDAKSLANALITYARMLQEHEVKV